MSRGGSWLLLDDIGRRLYEGGGPAEVSGLDFLWQKAGPQFEGTGEFLEWGHREGDGRFRVGGVVEIAGSLDLATPLVLAPGGGGILLIEEGARLGASLRTEQDEPLTLVALGGDVVVDTEEPVAAALVSLQGRVRLGPRFDVRGAVVAGSLQVEASETPGTRQIVYNQNLDPTGAARHRRAYRVMTPPTWRTFIP